MAFYDMFLQSTQAPKEYWKQGLQELVNVSFDNASTYQTDVEEEDEFGSLNFHPIICRIGTIVDAKTGQRVNDDYKQVIFPDIDKITPLGTRFRFDDNIWMCYSTDNIKTDTSSVYVRRCNNVLTTEDKYGKLHQEPCFIDYKVTETQLFQEYTMTTPAARITVTCQVNEHTIPYGINSRFLIDGQVYRIREFNRFDRTRTFDANSTCLLSFYADVDQKNDADRLDLGVADYFEPAYTVRSAISNITNVPGYEDVLSPMVYFVDTVVNEPIIYSSTNRNVCTINQYNGEFQFRNPGSCRLYCRMLNNPDIYTVVGIEVVEELPDTVQIVVTPLDVGYIKLNTSQTWEVYSYRGGEKLDSKFRMEPFNVPVNCFDFTSTDNSFTVRYKRLYEDGILKVVCTNLDTDEEFDFYIELGGIW